MTQGMMVALATAAAVLATGCGCLSGTEALAKQNALEAANVRNAEPALRAAAEALGATLLPMRPREMPTPLTCPGADSAPVPRVGSDSREFCAARARELRGCAEPAPDGRSFRYRHEEVGTLLAIPVRGEGATYAGLARRGRRLFLLMPRVSPRKVASATRCHCGGMPTVTCPSEVVFMLEEIPGVEIEEVTVPMTQDYIDWDCEVRMM